MTNIRDLIIKNQELDWAQFDEQWRQGFDVNKVWSKEIVFDLNDFANPNLLLRWWDENSNNHDLKQVLKADSELLKFLNNNDFQTNFLNDQTKTNKVIKRFFNFII